MNRRSILILILLPFAVILPCAIHFGAVGAGDHEMIPKIGLFKALVEGSSIEWPERLNGGTFLLGSASMPLTPWDVLNLVLPFRWAYNLALILHVVIVGVGFYIWRAGSRGDEDLPEAPKSKARPSVVSSKLVAPNHYEISVRSPSSSILVSSLIYYLEWKASCEGRPLPVIRVNRAFLDVKYDGNCSTITIRFSLHSHRVGRAISFGCVSIWMVGILFLRKRQGAVR